ncbi:MAG: heavy metal translocating P-type ATPase [Candidatus Nanopelagicaceae bacterium]|nr:heavy metal translocating P-type ATPase [Candidatus Nanopelagicaceae bacterium]
MDVRTVDLKIEGMTCSSCVATLERALNSIPGVSANINFVTESAHATIPENVDAGHLINAIESSGYRASILSLTGNDLLAAPNMGWRLTLAIFFAIPTIVIAMVSALHQSIDENINLVLDSLNILHPAYAPWGWLAIALSIPVVFIAGWPIHRVGLRNLRHPQMDTLISLGTLVAFSWSVYVNATGNGEIYVEVAAGVMLFILVGRFLEARAKQRAGDAIRTLLDLGTQEVSILRNGEEVLAPISHLQIGDLFIARPGQAIATDGVIVEGSSSVDTSLVTGESLPQAVGPGSRVIGATLNQDGRLVIRAEQVGAETQLARITRSVIQAQGEKAPLARMADQISAIFVPVIIALSLITFLSWYFSGSSLSEAIGPAITLLVIACPCALGLATPIAFLVASGRGAQLGIIISSPAVLEDTREIDLVVLDKTGTVTTGEIDILAAEYFDCDKNLALTIIAALENHSEHVIGQSLVKYALSNGANKSALVSVSDFLATPGRGIAGRVEIEGIKYTALVGSPSAISYGTAPFTKAISEVLTSVTFAGKSTILLAWDGQTRAIFTIGDSIKVDSAPAIAKFRKFGITPWLISGDSLQAANTIAREAGIATENVRAAVLPDQKVAAIKELQDQGHHVLMIGDGVNDAAALASADLSMAMGTGTDTAIAVADITLVRSDLTSAITALKLSRKTLRIIKGNLVWAFAYNAIGIPIAAAGLLSPMYAGAAMALSSIFVVTNSLRLRKFK